MGIRLPKTFIKFVDGNLYARQIPLAKFGRKCPIYRSPLLRPRFKVENRIIRQPEKHLVRFRLPLLAAMLT
nr:hypothetical protein [uncultured Kingella sp.]